MGASLFLPFVPMLSIGVLMPLLYWLLLFAMLAADVTLTQIVKTWFYKKFGE